VHKPFRDEFSGVPRFVAIPDVVGLGGERQGALDGRRLSDRLLSEFAPDFARWWGLSPSGYGDKISDHRGGFDENVILQRTVQPVVLDA
jgi:hypothetical protein